MKNKIYIFLIPMLIFFLFCGCTKENLDASEKEKWKSSAVLPEGYFEVNFFSNPFNSFGKSAISGKDARVRHVRYIIYKSTGEYIKEKVMLLPSQGVPIWPLPAVKDTLPKGSYKAVFLGNVEKTLFPYAIAESSVGYADVLTNYNASYDDARIVLPNAEFSDSSEYYWANVNFSDTLPNPNVLLQRIIGASKLHRNSIDAQEALDSLVSNIVTQIAYKNIISNTVRGLLPNLVKNAIGPILTPILGGLVSVDSVVNPLVEVLVAPVTNALYDSLLNKLVNSAGLALAGNANQSGLLTFLGVALNPWADADADCIIVSINDFPKKINFDLNVTDVYSGVHKFRYSFNPGTLRDERYITVKGFNDVYDIRKINVIKRGLISGLVVDQVIDGFLLPGAFVDIIDTLNIREVKTNRRYQSDYSILDLGLKSYVQQTDGQHNITLTIRLGDIANIDGLLRNSLTSILTGLISRIPLLGTVLSSILTSTVQSLLSPLKLIEISVPLNLPLLGIDNLSVSGGWSKIESF